MTGKQGRSGEPAIQNIYKPAGMSIDGYTKYIQKELNI